MTEREQETERAAAAADAAALEAFAARVFADAELAAELRAIDDREQFIARVLERGASRGFAFGRAAVEALMREHGRRWRESWL